jgi:hypothetical protein
MIDLLVLLLAIGIFAFGVYSTSRTSFGRRPMDPGPFWVQSLLEVPIFILAGVVMTSFDGVRELWIFRGVNDASYQTAIWALYYGLVAYFATILLADKLLYRIVPPPKPRKPANRAWLAGLMLAWQCLMLSVLLAFVREVPVIGIFTGAEIGVLRKAATHEFGGPAVLISLIKLYGQLGIFVLAATRQTLHSRSLRALLWMTSLLCLTWSGEKSPVVIALLGYWFLRAHSEQRQVTLRQLGLLATVTAIVALGIYSLVTAAGDMLTTLWFFGIRAFLGQISGYFQTISNFSPDTKYMLSWVPFGGTLSDQLPIFARDLMLMTEGDTATSGNLNTFFLAEAYGVGGWPMLLISPFIVATSVIISMHILRRWLTRQMGSEFALCGIYLFLMNSWLTSGMASFPAFRSLIVVGFVLATVVMPYRLLSGMRRIGGITAVATKGVQ